MPSNKPVPRNVRTGGTTVIPLGSMPRSKGSFFGGDGLGPLGVLFCLLFCVAAALIMDMGVLPPPYTDGVRSPVDFYSRATFTYNDPEAAAIKREDFASRAPRIYVEEEDWEEKILGDLDKLTVIVDKAENENEARDKATEFNKTYVSLVSDMYRKRGPELARLLSVIRIEVAHQSTNYAILSDDNYSIEANKREPRKLIVLSIRGGKQSQREIPAQRYRRLIDTLDTMKSATNRDSTPAIKALQWQLSAYLESKNRSNMNLDTARTEARQLEEAAKVGTEAVTVPEGDEILKKNIQIGKSKLERMRQEMRAVKAKMSWPERLLRLGGLAVLCAGVLGVFVIVAYRVDPGIWSKKRGLVVLGLLNLGALAGCRALCLVGLNMTFAPFVFVAMAASLAFGQMVAVLSLIGLSFLAAFSTICWESVPVDGGMVFFSLAMFAGGITSALPAKKLRDRWDLLKYGMFGGLVQGTLMLGMCLLSPAFSPLAESAKSLAAPWPHSGFPSFIDAFIAYLNGPIFGLLTLGSLPLIEYAFAILTNIRLFELADLNHPALQKLQLEAPGTFAHTLQVRFLAEPASDAIGAHTRLVSAAVLYHDLGKTLKPEYFIENTPEAEFRHKRLKPSVSAMVIIAHVKDGMDLARDYNLPQQIIDFIPQHHGTTLVSYFYHSAVRDAEKDSEGSASGTEVQEAFFRYPGPKPRTREAAIVMLADTIEAATRTLHNPSATRLRQFVHDLLMDKMLDNQLDESALTFAELALIEDAFLRVLATRFHSRIRYPGQEEEEEDDAPDAKGGDEPEKNEKGDKNEKGEKGGEPEK